MKGTAFWTVPVLPVFEHSISRKLKYLNLKLILGFFSPKKKTKELTFHIMKLYKYDIKNMTVNHFKQTLQYGEQNIL